MGTTTGFFTEAEMHAATVEPFNLNKWRQQGKNLVPEHHNKQWELGDWLDQGVGALTKNRALAEASRITGYARTTLWDFARTSAAFPDSPDFPESRRRELSWSHHKEVAIDGLSPKERCALLDDTESQNWSITQLRTRVRNVVKKKQGNSEPVDEYKLQVVVSAATYEFIKLQAKTQHITPSKRASLYLEECSNRKKP